MASVYLLAVSSNQEKSQQLLQVGKMVLLDLRNRTKKESTSHLSHAISATAFILQFRNYKYQLCLHQANSIHLLQFPLIQKPKHKLPFFFFFFLQFFFFPLQSLFSVQSSQKGTKNCLSYGCSKTQSLHPEFYIQQKNL